MIGRISMGNGFSGALKYDAKEGSELIATNCASTSPAEIAREMRLVANSNSHCKKPVFHTSLSLPKADKLTNEQWQKIGERYLNIMKFEGHQFAIMRHSDSKHDHIHICVNRVNLETGKAWSDSKSKYREMDTLRQIEKEFGLTKIDKNYEPEKKGNFESLKSKIDESLKVAGADFSKFKFDLEKSGVSVIENRSETTGRVSGLSFQSGDSKVFKGSQLGKTYSVNGLQSRGLQINEPSPSQALPQQGNGSEKASHLPSSRGGEGRGSGSGSMAGFSKNNDESVSNFINKVERQGDEDARARNFKKEYER